MKRSDRHRRRIARQFDTETDRILQPGVRATSRAWRSMRKAIMDTALAGGDLRSVVRPEFTSQRVNLGRTMALAYMRGIQRTITMAGPYLPIQLALHGRKLRRAGRDLGLSEQDQERIIEDATRQADDALNAAGTSLEARLQTKMDAVIAQGLTRGKALIELRKVIQAAGLGPTKSHTLEAIYRTQTQVALNAGRWDSLQAPEVQEILWGYEYVTVGDDRVRLEHAAFDGTKLPKKDGFWAMHWPPNGWNCRCSTVEIFEPEQTRGPEPGGEVTPGFEGVPSIGMADSLARGSVAFLINS